MDYFVKIVSTDPEPEVPDMDANGFQDVDSDEDSDSDDESINDEDRDTWVNEAELPEPLLLSRGLTRDIIVSIRNMAKSRVFPTPTYSLTILNDAIICGSGGISITQKRGVDLLNRYRREKENVVMCLESLDHFEGYLKQQMDLLHGSFQNNNDVIWVRKNLYRAQFLQKKQLLDDCKSRRLSLVDEKENTFGRLVF